MTSARWADRGGMDDDEHLAAYNAFLARLNQGPGNGRPSYRQASPGRPRRVAGKSSRAIGQYP